MFVWQYLLCLEILKKGTSAVLLSAGGRWNEKSFGVAVFSLLGGFGEG